MYGLVVVIIFSLILSFLAGKFTIINADAICYLQSAEMMNTSLSAAIHLCDQAKWPFYSMLIFYFSKLTSLSLMTSAYTLNALFSFMTIVVFICIVRLFTDSKITLWLAALVILLAPEFNSVKHYIVRDHGFWAFYLLSIWFLLKYFRLANLQANNVSAGYAWGWSLSLLAASLFRIEGLVFLLLIPGIVFFNANMTISRKIKSFFLLNGTAFILSIFLLVICLVHPEQNLLRLVEIKTQLFSAGSIIFQNLHSKSIVLGQQILGQAGMRDAMPVLFLTLIIWYIFCVISNLSFIYFLLLIYASRNKLFPWAGFDRFVIFSYVLVNLLVTSVFYAENLFLSKRYLIALSLILMLWVPFALNKLMRNIKIGIGAVILVLISSLGGIVNFGYSKEYVRDSGAWLAAHVPASAQLYSNNYEVMYYSKHFGSEIFAKWRDFSNLEINTDKLSQFDYLAVYSDLHSVPVKLPLIPVKIFKNKRGDQVAIYELRRKTA